MWSDLALLLKQRGICFVYRNAHDVMKPDSEGVPARGMKVNIQRRELIV